MNKLELGGAEGTVIKLSNKNLNYIKYAAGYGNVTIYGLAADDILKITDGTYTTVVSGNNLIIKVGESSITAVNAANIGLLILGKMGGDSSDTSTTVTSGLTYNADSTAVTVEATYSDTTLSNYESTVITIDAASRTAGINIVGNSNLNKIRTWAELLKYAKAATIPLRATLAQISSSTARETTS